jgi:hypothetical protein
VASLDLGVVPGAAVERIHAGPAEQHVVAGGVSMVSSSAGSSAPVTCT